MDTTELEKTPNQNGEIPKSTSHIIVELIEYEHDSVVSKSIMKRATGSINAMSFDNGEGLNEKTSPFDTYAQIIDGSAMIVIDGKATHLHTGEGIIILDTLFTYNSEEEIVGGLKKLGLDPMKVKYVIITHAHSDHVGGAKLLRDLSHAKIVMGGPDWDSIEKSVNGYPAGKPKRDITADDGQKITLGDTSVTILTTPGHTPGTLSMIFQVRDNGKPLTVIYSGGTAFNFPSTGPNFDIYTRSQAKLAAAAAAAGATVFMSNHSEFDNAVPKIRMIASRKPGEPHPFEIGKEAIARYFIVGQECAAAAKLRFADAQ